MSQPAPLPLSIVIPTLNESANVRAALDALQALRAQGVEVLVVDGGSSDDTCARAAHAADRVITAPRGRASQMNAGARVARGERILFLHADSRLPAGACERVIASLPAGGLAWGRFDVQIEGVAPMLNVIAWMMNLRSRLTGIATGDQGIFMTRAAFEKVEGFPMLPLMEDIEMSARLKAFAAPVCLRERIQTSGRRWETRGLWRTILLMWRLRLMYFFGARPQHLHDLYHGR